MAITDAPPFRSWWCAPDRATLYAADGRTVLATVSPWGGGYRGFLYDATRRHAGARRTLVTDTMPTLDDAIVAVQDLLTALEQR